MKILVVDDSRLCRRAVEKYLGDLIPEATIIQAENGARGYELCKKESPDFMILDLLMPEMGGLEVLQKLKDEQSAVKTVVLSADVQKITISEALELGALQFYPKPFSREQAADIAALIKESSGG